MARNEYKGKRVPVTLDPELYEILVDDAQNNGLAVATRAKQLLTIMLRNIQDGNEGQFNSNDLQKNKKQEQTEQEDNIDSQASSVVIPTRFKV